MISCQCFFDYFSCFFDVFFLIKDCIITIKGLYYYQLGGRFDHTRENQDIACQERQYIRGGACPTFGGITAKFQPENESRKVYQCRP
jgi:hypothetical protein